MFTFLYAFDLEFFADGEIYRAKVHKVPSQNPLAIEYYVFDIRPELPKTPSNLTFVYHPSDASFDYKVFNGKRGLFKSISTAIKKYCHEHDIQLA